MKIFKAVKAISYEERMNLKIEFHELLDKEIATNKIKRSHLSGKLSVSIHVINNCFSVARDSFDEDVFMLILRELDGKSPIRTINKIVRLYKSVYLDFSRFKLQMMFEQLDNFEAGYCKQKPSFAIGKLKMYTDILYNSKAELEKAGF